MIIELEHKLRQLLKLKKKTSFSLLYDNKELSVSRTLMEYNIGNKSVINLRIHTTGGYSTVNFSNMENK